MVCRWPRGGCPCRGCPHPTPVIHPASSCSQAWDSGSSVVVGGCASRSGGSGAGRAASSLSLSTAHTRDPPYEQRLVGVVRFGGLLVRRG
jgi:hypothetical protein